jgi:hypothetical protein
METADKNCDYHLKAGFSSMAICFVRKSWNMKSGDLLLRYLASYGANTLRV